MEELEFLLLRVQSIVLQCQAEKVPTFSSIPVFLQQLRVILRVYEEDDILLRQYKEQTLTVRTVFVVFIIIWSIPAFH
jgi:hypothetical protein